MVVHKMHIFLIPFLIYLTKTFICGGSIDQEFFATGDSQERYSKQHEEKNRDPWRWYPVSRPFGDDSTPQEESRGKVYYGDNSAPYGDNWELHGDTGPYEDNWRISGDNTEPYWDNWRLHGDKTGSYGNNWGIHDDNNGPYGDNSGSHVDKPGQYGDHGNRAKPLKVKTPKNEDEKFLFQSLFGGHAYVPPYMPPYMPGFGVQYYGEYPVYHPPFHYSGVYNDAISYIRKDKDKSYVPYYKD